MIWRGISIILEGQVRKACVHDSSPAAVHSQRRSRKREGEDLNPKAPFAGLKLD